ncbi:MAG TPA: branched-chain amino acid transaminase [Candidatus Limnocylindrales bacterium]|jgi:branched-chain amino acid aminotransferase|nr:branched-chain amino acid transaminase [Candidatus Limnocylindrales bacterium]
MLTHKASRSTLPATGARPSDSDIVAFFGGEFVPLGEARIPVMTHGFLYGTATFEGIRAYWNEEQEQLYGLKLKEHYRRMLQSAHILLMKPLYSADELVQITVDLLRRNGFRQDTYVRPTMYKSTEAIGVRLHNLDDAITIFAVPFGEYIAIDRGISAQTVSWRRNSDQALPARSKITGAYANSAFSKSEAVLNGYDEAIVLTADGHVSEGSAENLFMVRDGTLITPSVTDDILEGITRGGLIQLARNELGLEPVARTIDRSELYIADEVFLCGTGAQISPVVEIDHRSVGDGKVGPITQRLTELYFDVVRGRNDKYSDWVTPIY